MATDSTHLLPSDTSVEADSDMAGSAPDFASVQLAAASGDAPIPVKLPHGNQIVVIPVKPGQTIELPTDSPDGLYAKLGADGNLAIVVDGRTIILQGYAAANEEAPIKVVTNDGDVVDITEVVAGTSPDLDIQTAAGPGEGVGPQGNTDATGTGIYDPFAAGPLLGGFDAVGVLGATALQYKTIDDKHELFTHDEANNLPQDIVIVPHTPVAEDGSLLVDEDDLASGTADGPQDDPGSHIASGAVVVNFGLDGPAATNPIVLKDIAPGTPSGLFALGGGVDPTVPGGEVLLFLDAPSGGTQVLHGFVGAVEYITLTINTSTGEFEVVEDRSDDSMRVKALPFPERQLISKARHEHVRHVAV